MRTIHTMEWIEAEFEKNRIKTVYTILFRQRKNGVITAQVLARDGSQVLKKDWPVAMKENIRANVEYFQRKYELK